MNGEGLISGGAATEHLARMETTTYETGAVLLRYRPEGATNVEG